MAKPNWHPTNIADCRDPDSCFRHKECMYLGCSAHPDRDILKRALEDAKDHIPSEEITYTEMMENLANARREAERKGQKR